MKSKGKKKNFFDYFGFVKAGNLVFDVGCVTGKFTSQFLGIGATVVCIEADQRNIKTMRDIYGETVTLVNAAVTDHTGRTTLYTRTDKRHRCTTLVPEIYTKQLGKSVDAYNRVIEVRAVTLDALIEKYGEPAFIKLDIEGSEFMALSGLSALVPSLSFEFASGYIEEAHKCVKLLGQRDYEFTYVSGHHGDFERDWAPAKRFKFDIPERNADGKLTWGNVYARLRGG